MVSIYIVHKRFFLVNCASETEATWEQIGQFLGMDEHVHISTGGPRHQFHQFFEYGAHNSTYRGFKHFPSETHIFLAKFIGGPHVKLHS